jgi:replication factor A1
MKDKVEQILSRLRDQGVEVPEAEVEARLRMLLDKFRVPEGEARRSVLNYFLKEHGVTPAKGFSKESSKVKVAEVKEPNRWIDLGAKVVQLWEPTTDAISQTGLLGDETGRIKFTKWSRDNLPKLQEGKSYLIKSAVTDEFQGKGSIKLTRNSKVEEIPDVEAASSPLQAEASKVADINEAGRWIDIRAKVVQLWENSSDSISQSGLIGDETGTIKFVKWVKADLPDLEEGKSYLFKNLVTDEFQGRFSVKFNRTSIISELSDEVEVGSQSAQFTGALVDIQKGSGLIKRCPICRRSLAKGICGEHGKVDGAYDLRIKAVLDDGRRVQDILLNRETTERLVGLTLDQAKQMAMEALDHEVVRSMIEERLVGRYYSATGPRVDRYILVEAIEAAPGVRASEVDDLLAQTEVD